MVSFGWRMAALAATVLLVGAACGSVTETKPGPGTVGARNSGHSVDLATLTDTVAARYRFIEAHQSLAQRIPCYCGCTSLGHRDLRDCFITARGGYEEHAAGCGVCVAEAQDVELLLAQGLDAGAIRTRIDATYGRMGPSTNTP